MFSYFFVQFSSSSTLNDFSLVELSFVTTLSARSLHHQLNLHRMTHSLSLSLSLSLPRCGYSSLREHFSRPHRLFFRTEERQHSTVRQVCPAEMSNSTLFIRSAVAHTHESVQHITTAPGTRRERAAVLGRAGTFVRS